MKASEFNADTSQRLFEFLAHGNDEHRAWLAEAIEAFRLGLPRPEKRG